MKKQTKKEVISEYMSELGKKAGAVNKKKGSAYFKWVRSHGKQKKEDHAKSKDGASGSE